MTSTLVLILGAGASIPYGFPSGTQLASDILVELEQMAAQSERGQGRVGWDAARLRNCASHFARSGHQSIDAFLINRPEFAQDVQIAIARIIGKYEKRSVGIVTTGRNTNDLGAYIFRGLLGTPRARESSRAKVITLNYDRSLEQSLATKLSANDGSSPEEAHATLHRLLPIHHLHGSIGALDSTSIDFIKYGGGGNLKRPDGVTDKIRFIHEAGPLHESYELAQTWLHDSRTICFLGFGYHEEVLVRLGVKQLTSKRIVGSAHGLTPSQVTEMRQRVGLINADIDTLGRESVEYLKDIALF